MDEMREDLFVPEIPEENILPESSNPIENELFIDASSWLIRPEHTEEYKYECPCCGKPGFSHAPNGSWDICEICGWEDDLVQLQDPDFAGGANELSLNQARVLFHKKSDEEL